MFYKVKQTKTNLQKYFHPSSLNHFLYALRMCIKEDDSASLLYKLLLCAAKAQFLDRSVNRLSSEGMGIGLMCSMYSTVALHYGQQAELRVHRLQELIPIPGIRYICIKYSIIICLNNLLSFLQQYMHRHCQSLKVNNYNNFLCYIINTKYQKNNGD